jgi:hypothetical protein
MMLPDHFPGTKGENSYSFSSTAKATLFSSFTVILPSMMRRDIFLIHLFVVLLFLSWCYLSDDEFLASFPGFPIALANDYPIIAVKLYGHFDFHRFTSVIGFGERLK